MKLRRIVTVTVTVLLSILTRRRTKTLHLFTPCHIIIDDRSLCSIVFHAKTSNPIAASIHQQIFPLSADHPCSAEVTEHDIDRLTSAPCPPIPHVNAHHISTEGGDLSVPILNVAFRDCVFLSDRKAHLAVLSSKACVANKLSAECSFSSHPIIDC